MKTVLAFVLSLAAVAQRRAPVTSKITLVHRDGRNARIIHMSLRLFEAPNWSPDGKYLGPQLRRSHLDLLLLI